MKKTGTPITIRPLSGLKVLLIGGCGYIGSYLYQRLLEQGVDVSVCDLELRGNPLNVPVLESDYRNLSPNQLILYDAVLWFAGHSSVAKSINDPEGALDNNCLSLFKFVQLLNKKTKFVYASTASLYSSEKKYPAAADEDSLKTIPMNNPYDSSKFVFDYLISTFSKNKNFFGLRMGTVSGYSPNMRPELVFNAMSIAAYENGIVALQNGDSWRTILFLDDLWTLVRTILIKPVDPGFVNAGSLSMTIRALANEISSEWDAAIENKGDSRTYSFKIDLAKMKTLCGQDLGVRFLREESKKFINLYRFK
jgi:nucleoside-diphosphate-sugar epimerase